MRYFKASIEWTSPSFSDSKQRTPGGPVSPMLAALLGTLSLGQSNYCMKYDDVVANYCPSRACVTYRCEQQKQGQVVILASSGPFPPPLLAHSQAAPPPQPHPRASLSFTLPLYRHNVRRVDSIRHDAMQGAVRAR